MRLATSTRLCFGAIIISMLTVWSLSVVPDTLAWQTPRDLDLTGVSCPENPNCKTFRPEMAAQGNYVHLIYLNDSNDSVYYHRGTTNNGTVSWERGRLITGNGGPSNDAIGIVADVNNTVHIVYSRDKQIFYTKNTNNGSGNWSGAELVGTSDGERVIQLGIALDADRTPHVAWGQGIDPGYIAYSYREPTGNWRSSRLEGSRQYLHRNIRIAASGSGANAVAHIFAETERRANDPFYISYARVPRAGFTPTISNWSYPFESADDSDNFPSVTVDPVTGFIYAGYVDGNIRSGYRWAFSISRDNGATWTEPIDVRPYGSGFWGDYTPMIAYDNTVYMMVQVKQMDGVDVTKWGFADVRYLQTENRFEGPFPILNYADSNRTVDRSIAYAISTDTKVGVWIRNFTEGPGYNSDPGGIEQVVRPRADITINNGEASTRNTTLNIALSNVIGSPSRMRVSVDTPITNATPLETYQASFTRTVSNPNLCLHTVYVQLVNDEKGLSSDVVSDNITVDSAVQADSIIRNPYKRGNSVIFSQVQQTSPLVTDGDSEYTRVPAFYIEVNGSAECSQLTTVRVGRSTSSLPLSYNIASNSYANVLPIPGQLLIGSNTIVLEVTDNVGNTQVYSREIKYDPTPPTLVTSGTLTVDIPETGPNVLTTLSVEGDQVTDNMYPGRGFWGVWVANSRTPIADPVNDVNLAWQPVEVTGTTSDFTLANWSVLGGIPAAEQTPGDYYVYVRFLDGAGNPTAGYLEQQITLDQIVKPSTHLPTIRK